MFRAIFIMSAFLLCSISNAKDIKSPNSLIVVNSIFEGGVDAGGGDQIAAEFIQKARSVLAIFQKTEISKSFPEVSTIELENAVQSVRIISSDKELILEGVRVDAINRPSKNTIEIDRERWLEYFSNNSIKTLSLVFHEYLGIMRVPDVNYRLSENFRQWLENNQYPGSRALATGYIFKYTFEKDSYKRETLCKKNFVIEPSYSDRGEHITCKTEVDGQRVVLRLGTQALISKGFWLGWPSDVPEHFSYGSWLNVSNKRDSDITFRLNKSIEVNYQTTDIDKSGHAFYKRLISNEVTKRIINCNGSRNQVCSKLGEPNVLFSGFVNVNYKK